MKVLIRSGFELVMERERQYTPDLFLCYQTFSKYYPKQEKAMQQCLHYYLNPIESFNELRFLVQNFGRWLATSF